MPAIQPRPDRPSLYPDWSTLVDAFAGLSLDAKPGQRELAGAIHEVEKHGNLCLSFAHLLELLRAEDVGQRRERAAWLDSMNIVWLLDLDEVRQLELERLLRAAAKLPVGTSLLPAAGSFLVQFRLAVHQVPELLHCGTVLSFVDGAGSAPRVRSRLESFAAQGPAFAQQFFVDRRRAKADGHSSQKLENLLKAKLDAALLQEALETNRRLAQSSADYFVQRGRFSVPPDDDFVRAAMRPLSEAPHALPSAFAFFETTRRFGNRVGDEPSVRTKFLTKDERRGDPFDWWHLIGAAYCDTFVCDSVTSQFLGKTRLGLGRAKELVATKPGQLAADIRRCFDAVRR